MIPELQTRAERPPPDLGREDVLYDSAETRIYRLHLADGGSVICKEPRGPGAAQRLRHEREILERLEGVTGVPRLAPVQVPNAIAMEDADAVPFAGPDALGLEALGLTELALAVAGIVAAVHRRGVLHKDINPSNIVFSQPGGRPLLIDYHLATTFAEQRPTFVHPSEIVGTLPYLAPEQSGRTGRSTDERSDLYSLGATFYELATGRPPFGDGDLLQLLHDHLARVPTPPAEIDPRIPPTLSAIVMRLLEKEQDQRYQSADGLVHDLSRLRDELAAGCDGDFALGERDFPLRLAPPSRLVGREPEIGALREAFDEAIAGGRRGVLVSGASGVGKSALVDELRPMVTARRGWFVTGKAEQFQRDSLSGAASNALRAIGRLLLAEPEAELAAERERIRSALGPNAPLLANVIPEFAVLLGPLPEASTGDPATVRARLRNTALELFRTIATAGRPIVVVLDDLQWATPTAIEFADSLLTDEALRHVLVVGSFRDAEIDAVHPLTAAIARWERLGMAPRLLRLENLPPADLSSLLAEMLRLRPEESARLAEAIGSRTGGNPYDTVELVNGLRQDGALVAGEAGWCWDEATIRRYIGRGEVVDLIAVRIAKLPPEGRELVEMMACLGGHMHLGLLQTAADRSSEQIEVDLLAPLEDGLIVVDDGGHQLSAASELRFRHDRVQEVAYDRLSPERRTALHAMLARRLAEVAEFADAGSGQYLAALDAVESPTERRHVAEMFRTVAATALRRSNYVISEGYLAAAMQLLHPVATTADDPLLAQIETDWHAALYSLGRHSEADEIYRSIERHCGDPLVLAEATCNQVNSLSNRGLQRDALDLGLEMLGRLGLDTPDDMAAAVSERMDAFIRWFAEVDVERDLRRPPPDDPYLLAAAKLGYRLLAPAYFCDEATHAWLVMLSQRLWAEQGPCASLVASLSSTGFSTIGLREDYRTGSLASRHALAIGEARGYEPEASWARYTFGLFTSPWLEPLEDSTDLAQRAREGLLQGGEQQFATFSYLSSLAALLDCSPTLDLPAAEIDRALAAAARIGHDQCTACFLSYRQTIRAIAGDTRSLTDFSEDNFDEQAHLDSLGIHPMAYAILQVHHALTAALAGDEDGLARHSAAALEMLPFIQGFYEAALAHMWRALALAGRARTAGAAARTTLLAELDGCREWLSRRASDAPGNFLHLVQLVEAERAWAVGDLWAATRHFDEALGTVASLPRPWHRALIAERAGVFHTANGLRHTGRELLDEAFALYAAWGATAKVRQMEERYNLGHAPADLHRALEPDQTVSVSVDEVDMIGLLRASQALSSETTLGGLKARVVELLREMTGATTVRVVLYDADAKDWFLSTTDDEGGERLSVEQAAVRGLLPLSAFRYTERTGEALLVSDATHDDRFRRDPYVAQLDQCSLLVVPILNQGEALAILVLDNRLSRGAFAADRLDAVMLIVGQLAVSLQNAVLYDSLERKVADRTEALEVANTRLEALSITDPLTGLANRRRFADVLSGEWLRSSRTHTPLGAAMADVDKFKAYNDRYGHIAGDDCLRRVAEQLSAYARDGMDLVARYGGEEFAVILPGADFTTTFEAAERLRSAVEALREPHEGVGGGIVTVSVGVASLVPSPGAAGEQLIALADARLYEAKRSGRNRVVGQRTL